MDVMFPENLSILLHGVISLPDATSCDNCSFLSGDLHVVGPVPSMYANQKIIPDYTIHGKAK